MYKLNNTEDSLRRNLMMFDVKKKAHYRIEGRKSFTSEGLLFGKKVFDNLCSSIINGVLESGIHTLESVTDREYPHFIRKLKFRHNSGEGIDVAVEYTTHKMMNLADSSGGTERTHICTYRVFAQCDDYEKLLYVASVIEDCMID